MYASRVWGTEYVQEGQEFSSVLQVRHMRFLKGTLGVKCATIKWAALRECGLIPLQFYLFKSAIKMYNGRLDSNFEMLRGVLKAYLHLYSRALSCWTAQILDVFQGVQSCTDYAVHGELLKEWIYKQETTNWPYIKHSLPCLLTKVCASLSGYQETAPWEDGMSPVCDTCSCGQIQDEAHVPFMCRCEGLCALRHKYS
eukprot:1146231-Pelagomonas_calceolata.AAC.1